MVGPVIRSRYYLPSSRIGSGIFGLTQTVQEGVLNRSWHGPYRFYTMQNNQIAVVETDIGGKVRAFEFFYDEKLQPEDYIAVVKMAPPWYAAQEAKRKIPLVFAEGVKPSEKFSAKKLLVPRRPVRAHRRRY